MWILVVLIVLFLFVLILYLTGKKKKKSVSSSLIQRNQLESLLEKELTPKSIRKDEVEKGDFRYQDDYKKSIAEAGDIKILNKEYEQILKGGINKLKVGDYDGAELEFSKIIDSDTANAAAYYYRGFIKNKKEEYINALNDFDLAFAYGFQKADLHLQRGLSNFHLKYYDKASAEFTTFLAFNPDNTEALFNKGLADVALKDFPAAISEFTKIIELNPNHETAFFERAKIYLEINDKKSACRDFQEAFDKGCLPAHHYLKTICNPDTSG